MNTAAGIILELRGISKVFPGVRALERIDLRVHANEVLGLIGENGAGKSTLMNIIGGVLAPTGGVIVLDGVELRSLTVPESMRRGIAFIHQELNVLDNLDVAANMFLGREFLFGGALRLIDRRKMREQAAFYLRTLGIDLPAEAAVSCLSTAQRQMVEIARALSMNARIIIMDEPTSSLTLSEAQRLLALVRGLKARGVSVIYISHRISEVRECADRVCVLRDGRNAGELAGGEITHDNMVRLMIGRALESFYGSAPGGASGACRRPGAFRVEGLRTLAYPARPVSFEAAGGGILGFAGLVGAGRTELAQTIFGVMPRLAGAVFLDSRRLDIRRPADAIRHGIYLAPEDRKRSGLVLEMSVRENITLPDMRSHSRCRLIRRALERATAERQCRALRVKTPSAETAAVHLSGGNQQKVVLARWLALNPRVLLLDEPTRGIDVGAKAEIYRLMRAMADRGVVVIMISSDMEELLRVSDRIAVMSEGSLTGVLERDSFSEENIMRLAVPSGARAPAACG